MRVLAVNDDISYPVRERYLHRLALVIGLTLHLSLLSTFLVLSAKGYISSLEAYFSDIQNTPVPFVEMVDLPAGLPVDRETARALLREKMAEWEKLDTVEKDRRLREYLNRSAEVKKQSIPEIAEFLGIEQGSYQPRAEPPEGPFDYNTATVDKLEKIAHPKLGRGYHIIFVDREGRTMEGDVYGVQARPYDRLYEILKLAENNPAFGVIYQQLAKPILAEMAQKRYEARVDANRRRMLKKQENAGGTEKGN